MVSALMKVFALPLLTARRIVSFLGIPADVSEGSVVSAVVVPAVTPNWRTSGVQRGYPQHPDDMLGGYKFTNEKDKVCFESAAYYGATAFINYRGGSIEEQVMDITGGHGVDRVIVAGGEDEAISIGWSNREALSPTLNTSATRRPCPFRAQNGERRWRIKRSTVGLFPRGGMPCSG